MNKIILPILLSLLSFGYILAQDLRVVQGRVTNIDGEPLSGAEITIKNCDHSTTSDELGNFQLKSPYGYNYVTASKEGYWPCTLENDGSFLLFKLKIENSSSKKRKELKREGGEVVSEDTANSLVSVTEDETRMLAKQKAIKDSTDKAEAEIMLATWNSEYKELVSQIKMLKREIDRYELRKNNYLKFRK